MTSDGHFKDIKAFRDWLENSRKNAEMREAKQKMATPIKRSVQFTEALSHLERLVNLCIEWQTDWSAISPETKTGKPNPDFDKEYLVRLRENPSDVYDPAVLAARDFLKSLKR